MNNEIEKHGKAAVVPKSNEQSLSFHQPIDTLVTHADEINANTYNTYNFISHGFFPGMPATHIQPPPIFNHDYYNLLVYGGECFFSYDDSRNHITISKDRCLEQFNTDSDIRAEFCSLSSEVVKRIKTFPAVIAYENDNYGTANNDHAACFGYFTDVKNRSNGIEIYFHPIQPIPQQPLNNLLFELGLGGHKRFNELNHSHWTIKRIDLLEVLRENNLLKDW